MGVILYSGWYSPELCQAHPDKLFVFGDNLLRFGKGGQAVIRDEPNAFGVPTKRKPAMSQASFFSEDSEADLDAVLISFQELWVALKDGKAVVIPVIEKTGLPSLGCERAELPQRAPTIYEAICRHVREMSDTYGADWVVDDEQL